MSHVEAVYRHGVFEPLGPVNLHEDQRVRLSIESAEEEDARAWLNRVQELQAGIVRRGGYLPDSSPEIASDRMR